MFGKEESMHLLKEPVNVKKRESRSLELRIAQAQRLLESSGDPALQSVQCDDREGTLVLRGWVPSYCAKQVAKPILLKDSDVGTFYDEIEVSHCVPGTSYPRTWR